MKYQKLTILLTFIFVFFCLSMSAYAETKYVVLLDPVNIRKGPGTNYSRHALGSVGSTYNLKSETIVPDEPKNGDCDAGWYEINYNGSSGYVCSEYVRVEKTEVEENRNPTNTCEVELQKAGFPSSYWSKLCELKAKYPKWQFKAITTNIEWTTAVNKFTNCSDSLVSNPKSEWQDNTCSYSEGSFKPVNQTGVAYFLDPRNFLTERYIFQFEYNKYNSALANSYNAVNKSVIDSTSFYKYHDNLGTNLPALITQAGKETNINPVHLATRMYQELGTNTRLQNLYQGIFNGPVPNLEGTHDFRGYYNFYNIGVYGYCVQASGNGATYCGLKYAKNHNWNSVYAAVKGGGTFLQNEYITGGQYNSYLERFNVVPKQSKYMYIHYYMANLQAPSSESSIIYNAYKENNLLNSAFEFHIPVYKNMSATVTNSGNGAVNDSTSASAPSSTPISTIVTSAGFKVSNSYLTKISTNTKISSFISNIEAIGGNNTVTITNLKGSKVTTGNIGTGFKITIKNASEEKTYTALIKGDTSGDGIINAKDLLEVQKNILGTYKMSGAHLKAADTSGDGLVNAKDLLEVQKNILGTYTIE